MDQARDQALYMQQNQYDQPALSKRSSDIHSEDLRDQLDDTSQGAHNGGSKTRGKRRSKNETDGRVHKCNFCDKTYLSYPALYTHMKTKHAFTKGPDGQPITGFNNGRGRGRPRKNAKKVDPVSTEFFQTPDKKGGPTPIQTGFKECFEIVFKNDAYDVDYAKHPMYSIIKNYESGKYAQKKESDKKCDEIFVEYLDSVRSQVNESFYKSLVTFALLFRDCLNIHGWQKKKAQAAASQTAGAEPKGDNIMGQGETGASKPHTVNNPSEDEDAKEEEFAVVNNAEHAPEICNEFVTEYLDQKKVNFDRELAIDLTRNICNWLFIKGYTCSKLSMIN